LHCASDIYKEKSFHPGGQRSHPILSSGCIHHAHDMRCILGCHIQPFMTFLFLAPRLLFTTCLFLHLQCFIILLSAVNVRNERTLQLGRKLFGLFLRLNGHTKNRQKCYFAHLYVHRVSSCGLLLSSTWVLQTRLGSLINWW